MPREASTSGGTDSNSSLPRSTRKGRKGPPSKKRRSANDSDKSVLVDDVSSGFHSDELNDAWHPRKGGNDGGEGILSVDDLDKVVDSHEQDGLPVFSVGPNVEAEPDIGDVFFDAEEPHFLDGLPGPSGVPKVEAESDIADIFHDVDDWHGDKSKDGLGDVDTVDIDDKASQGQLEDNKKSDHGEADG